MTCGVFAQLAHVRAIEAEQSSRVQNLLAMKLAGFADLSVCDIHRLDAFHAEARSYPAKLDLIREGDRPEVAMLLCSGWACRYKVLPDGGRQIVAFLLPGDLCDPHVFLLKEMDHAIALLTAAKVALIPRTKIVQMFEESPALARAFWWSTLVDGSILREWLVNIGRRNAFDRVAHLFAELWLRMRAVGLTSGGAFDCPLTQADIADTVGLTAIHVNRTLQDMRCQGLIAGRRSGFVILDVPRLMEVSRFEPNYLHFDRRYG